MARGFPIKVCGITRLEDARLAAELGAFALGFIFHRKSPRYIEPEAARDIIAALRKIHSPLCVGVCVNVDAGELRRIQSTAGVDIMQLHGDETVDLVSSLKDLRLWKAFRLKPGETLPDMSPFEPFVEAFLVDAAVAGAYGGTGHRIDEDILARLPRRKPLVIAGGLDPGNWRSVAETYRPYAIDLSSGVETSPGIKDPDKLKKLFTGEG